MWSQDGLMPKTSEGTENKDGNVGRVQSHHTYQRQTPTVYLFINDCKHSPAFLTALVSVLSLSDTMNM